MRNLLRYPYFLKVWLEKSKLIHRASKYEWKDDIGGIAYLKKSIQRGDTVLDIGAHKAGYLYHLQKLAGKSGTVIAFEPQSVLFHYLTSLQQIFAWQNVLLESKAVSNKAGMALLGIPYNNGADSSPCATIYDTHMKFPFSRYERVSTTTIDGYCSQNSLSPALLKIDVEGNELAVFQGAIGILKKNRPKLLFECEQRFIGHARMLETFSFLRDLGYHGYYICKDKLFPLAGFSAAIHQAKPGSKYYCNNFVFEPVEPR
ncbi:MAG: hypothetical protein RLZZ28_1833 [Bacteroidota bacterium]